MASLCFRWNDVTREQISKHGNPSHDTLQYDRRHFLFACESRTVACVNVCVRECFMLVYTTLILFDQQLWKAAEMMIPPRLAFVAVLPSMLEMMKLNGYLSNVKDGRSHFSAWVYHSLLVLERPLFHFVPKISILIRPFNYLFFKLSSNEFSNDSVTAKARRPSRDNVLYD